MHFSRRDFFALLLPVLCGLANLGLWHLDLYLGPGWNSTAWLYQEMPSIYIITALTVLGYLIPNLLFSRFVHPLYVIFCALGCYATGLAAFFIAKTSLYELHQQAHLLDSFTHLQIIFQLFLVVILCGFFFFTLKQHLIFSSNHMHMLTLVFAFVSVVPASLISVEWLFNFGQELRFVDAIKMGYPFLWTPIFLGTTSYLMTRHLI